MTALLLLLVDPAAATAGEGTQPAATANGTTTDQSLGHDLTAQTYLAAHPGGTILNTNEISYDNGTFIVTLKPETSAADTTAGPRTAAELNPLAVVNCPSGWFCFYDRPDYGYPRGKLSSCGWQSLIPYGWQDSVESAYYNLPYGSAQFFDNGYAIFRISASSRAISDVTPFANRATEVYRYC